MEVKIIRSSKRRRTISTKEKDGEILLYLPLGLTREQEFKYTEWAKKRIHAIKRKKDLLEKNADEILEKKALELNKKYFGGELRWNQIIYSTEQNSRMFGNCDRATKTIRISDRLLKMPGFVHDYVVVHELAHLKVSGHGSDFWNLVYKFERTERAIGYLMAVGLED